MHFQRSLKTKTYSTISKHERITYFCVFSTCYLSFMFPHRNLSTELMLFEKTTWCSETKEEVRQVLTMEYTSSDESSYVIQNREEAELAAYKVKHLSCEWSKLTDAKQILDEIYLRSLSARVRRSFVPRIPHSVDSERVVLQNLVGWAVTRPASTARRALIPSATVMSSSRDSCKPLASSTSRVERENRM